MKIRSITYFFNPDWPFSERKVLQAGEFLKTAQPVYKAAGYEIQTARLATIPFPLLFMGLPPNEIIRAAQNLEKMAAANGFAYTALGPALIDKLESYTLIPDLIAATETIFCSGEIASPGHGVSLPAVRACAEIIHKLSPQDPNGFANLYFTALANVGPGSPFFPAAYHDGDHPQFAIATEAASLAVQAFGESSSLRTGILNFISLLAVNASALTKAGHDLEDKTGISFGGIDFSLSPFPEEASSLGTAVERMGVSAVGQHGSLAAAAILANALDQVKFKRIGFSGLLFPQLEDSTLAARAAEGILTVKDLLMYSAVCGTGLDTIPLPGDATPQELTPLLLDLAALAMRLDKPLTARLMPVPGKKAGDETSFDFDFFANSRVMALDSKPLGGLLAGEESFQVGPRV
jgi:uncharacterized protein (UPF0210 family)